MRSPLTETIKRVEGMIAYVRENLDEGEYDLFLDLILPEPEPAKAAKKGRKKSSKGGSKSSRASGMAAALKQNLNRQRQAIDRDYQPCQYHDGNLTCGAKEDNTIHDPTMGYAGYHEFQPAASSVAHEAGAGG